MIVLLTSAVCDVCDGVGTQSFHVGYVVWHPAESDGRGEYVFPTRAAAQKWIDARGFVDVEIRKVHSTHAFSWRKSTGSIKDIEFASRRYDIFPDQRHPAGPSSAFLA